MKRITFTWIKAEALDQYNPITQVYGICFNKKNEILIIKKPGENPWSIPGGRPEGGETPEETLKREMEEEATVLVQDIRLLGVQKVNYPDNPNPIEGDEFYQARYICFEAQTLDHTPDPDKPDGMQWDRTWVPAEDITKWVQWGNNGDQMFADAIELRRHG